MKKNMDSSWLLAFAAGALAFLVYLPALRNDFVDWDDVLYVQENSFIRSFGSGFFLWAFRDFYACNWHPLTWISHGLDYALWGLNPFGHHLTNVTLHAVNTALVVLLAGALFESAKESTGETGDRGFTERRAMLIAAGTTGVLFGIHPAHVESVAWISERKDLLCGLFSLLSLVAYTRYAGTAVRQSRGFAFLTNKRYLLALVLFALALLSKPMAVTMPVVLLLLDWYPLRRTRDVESFRSCSIEKLPFMALSLASSALTIAAQKAGHAVVPIELIALPTRLLVAARSLAAYLGNLILPVNLLPFYPYPAHINALSAGGLLPVLLLIAVTAICLLLAKKQKLWLAGWLYFLVTLIPVIGIVQVGSQAMADRYLYLPALGPFLITGVAAAAIDRRAMKAGKMYRSIQVAAGIAVVVMLLLSLLTIRQIGIWKNSFTLWDYEIEREPKTALAYNNRGIAFQTIGNIGRALEDYERALSLKPSYDKALFNRGTVFEKLDKFDKALADYDRAIAINPEYHEAYLNRGILLQKRGQTAQAMDDIRRSIQLCPSSDKAYFELGALFARAGLFQKAVSQFDRAVALNPENDEAYANRGTLYALLNRPESAFEDLSRAVSINKGNPVTYYNRGKLFLVAGNRQAAVSDFRKACDLGYDDGCRALTPNGIQ